MFFTFFIGGADTSCPHPPYLYWPHPPPFSPLTDVTGEEIPALSKAAVKYLKLLE